VRWLAGDEVSQHLKGAVFVIDPDPVACVRKAFETDNGRVEPSNNVLAIGDWCHRIVLAREHQGRTCDLADVGEEVR
jgi:hypothetical protein